MPGRVTDRREGQRKEGGANWSHRSGDALADGTAPYVRILYVVTEDWYFCSHRLPTARAARDLGYEVVVATNINGHADEIRREGFRVVPLPSMREARGPLGYLAALIRLVLLYRRERPDLIHHISLAPTLFGSIAVLLAGIEHSLATMTGLGFVFTSKGLRPGSIRAVIKPILRWVLSRQSHDMIFQNRDDLDFFVQKGIIRPEQAHLVRGSGVDTAALRPTPEPEGPITAIFVGRMLRTKGVGEIIEAARLLREKSAGVRIVLVGKPDPHNPESIGESEIRRWQDQGLIEWWGYLDDIAAVWAQAHIALLPSYREGLPKSLLEAAACGRPMIAADVPGCREIVRQDETGLLVPRQNAQALAEAITTLATDAALRQRMGRAARHLVEECFSDTVIAAEMKELYQTILARR